MIQPSSMERALQAFQIESDCILELHAQLNQEAFSDAVELLAAAPRIGTSGCGHSGIMCSHFAHLLCCIERPARFLSPSEALHGAMGFLQAGDVMVFASRGGKSAELLPMAEICNRRAVSVVTITENTDSPLARASTVVLKEQINRETDRYNEQGTTSSTALCVLFHALQAALIEETGFRSEDFAQIHPGGAVGERLRAENSEND